jgi:predicted DNA-binding transcriptional regulator AlpA
MKLSIARLVAKLLRETADRIDAGNTELSDSEAMDLAGILCHEVMSKDTACRYLNLSRSRFDDLVRTKKLPKGRKRVGFKELAWYRDELDECVRKLKQR